MTLEDLKFLRVGDRVLWADDCDCRETEIIEICENGVKISDFPDGENFCYMNEIVKKL